MDIASEAGSASRESDRVSFTVQRNALVFGAAMVFLQVGMSLVYGFLIQAQSVQFNAASVLVASGLAILVVAGTFSHFRLRTDIRLYEEIGVERDRLYLLHHCALHRTVPACQRLLDQDWPADQ